MEKKREYLGAFYVGCISFFRKALYTYLAVSCLAHGAMTVDAEKSLASVNAALRAFHPQKLEIQGEMGSSFSLFTGGYINLGPGGEHSFTADHYIYDWDKGIPIPANRFVSDLISVIPTADGVKITNRSPQFAQRLLVLNKVTILCVAAASAVSAEVPSDNISALSLLSTLNVNESSLLGAASDPIDLVYAQRRSSGLHTHFQSASDPVDCAQRNRDRPRTHFQSGSEPVGSDHVELGHDAINKFLNVSYAPIFLRQIARFRDPEHLGAFIYSAPQGQGIFGLESTAARRWNIDQYLGEYVGEYNEERIVGSKIIEGRIVLSVDSQVGENASIAYPPVEWLCTPPLRGQRFARLSRFVNECRILESRSAITPETGEVFLQSTAQNSVDSNAVTIPFNNIRMWISHVEAPLYALTLFVQNARAMPQVTPFFYCIDASKIPETIDFLRTHLPSIKIFETKELSHPLFSREIFDGLIADGYYTVASNLLRLFAVTKHGGMYCDLGAQVHPDILTLFDKYQQVFMVRPIYGSLLEGFVASVPNSIIINEILARYKYFPRVSKEYMDAVDRRNFGGVGLMSSEVYSPIIYKYRNIRSISFIPEGGHVKFNSMCTWIYSAGFGNKSTTDEKVTATKLLGYFGVPEKQVAVDTRGILLSNYAHGFCPLVEKIGEHFYGITQEEVKRARLQYHAEAVDNLLEKKSAPKNLIPNIFHQVWLTDGKTPHPIPQSFLDATKASAAVLGRPRVIIWTDGASTENVSWIVSQIPNSEVRSVAEIIPTMRGKAFFEELFTHKRYANASILLRYAVLDKMGGLYADFGTLLKPEIVEALGRFDYLFSQRSDYLRENWLDVNLMASRPGAQLWNKLFSFFDRLIAMRRSSEVLHPAFSEVKRYLPIEFDHAWISGHALSAAIDALMVETIAGGTSSEESLLSMAFDSLFKSGSTGSWHSGGKFGSKDMRDPAVQVRFAYLPG